MKTVTPLLKFLRALTAEQKRQFAADCTEMRGRLAAIAGHDPEKVKPFTVLYLTQLASQMETQNPTLLTAIPIVECSKRWARRVTTEPLHYEDLLQRPVDDGTGVG